MAIASGTNRRRATIAASLAWSRDSLKGAGVLDPLIHAERMLEDLLGLSRAEIYLHRTRELTESQANRFQHWVEQRASGKPLQYLLGHTAFFGLDLDVGEGVFIPRPETETLVETVLTALANPEKEKLKWLDVGTGSGAIAIALAVNLPQSGGVATDITERALRTAKTNAARNGVASRIRFESCDLFPSEREALDAVVSNPPYIPSGNILRLDREVKDFEPREALDGGPGGLSLIRRIVPEAKERLVPGGLLALEVGEGQAEPVARLMRDAGYERIAIGEDLGGVARVTSGLKTEARKKRSGQGKWINS